MVEQKNTNSLKTQLECDRISPLPDCLIRGILSFLEVPDVVNTSLLSPSWRYRWTAVSCLNFGRGDWERKTDKITFIHSTLFSYSGNTLQKLTIPFYYNHSDEAKIDSWVYFAIRHNVEHLALDLYHWKLVPENKWSSTRYKLPRSLYNCSSLISLTLSFCDLNLPVSIHLGSLKTLSLDLLVLSTETITYLTSNCPLLEDLTLNGCNMYSDLNIVITNKKLKSLTILDYDQTRAQTEIIISASHLDSLRFVGLVREKYHVKNMRHLSEFGVGGVSREGDHPTIYCEKDVDHFSVALLRELYYVVKMRLNMFIVQVLSIRDVQGMYPFCLSATFLQLETELTKWELPGISYLLKSSPKLKSLIVKVPSRMEELKFSEAFKDEFKFDEKGFWESDEYSFSPTLQNLEFVKIYFFSTTQKYGDAEEDIQKLRNKIEFVQFLLKNSVGLKKMIIKCGDNIQANPELLSKLTEELIVFARASCSSTVDII